jgi:hypothetical protein
MGDIDLIQQGSYNSEILRHISDIAQEIGMNGSHQNCDILDNIHELENLLNTYYPEASPIMQYLDAKSQDLSTYFLITYCSTRDIDQSLWVYRMVQLLVRYVLLYDRFYEIGDESYRELGIDIHKDINKSIADSKKTYLNSSLNYSLEQFWPFWRYEQMLKKQMLEGHGFSYKEIRSHNLFKSSDSSLIYSKVLESVIPDYSENISLILHYNQALLDIQDDLEDIEDDISESMPNVFVMACSHVADFGKLKSYGLEDVRNKLLSMSKESIVKLVNEYQDSLKSISIPEELAFLRNLSYRYTNTLLNSMNITTN